MKRLFVLGVVLASLCLPVLAAKNSQVFSLPWSVRLGDAQLPQGRCDVSWTEASGTQVQLTIKAEDKKTYTVAATFEPGKPTYVGPVTTVVDGVRHLKGFRAKDGTITIEGAPTETR
jgi:hypothetical protein